MKVWYSSPHPASTDATRSNTNPATEKSALENAIEKLD